MFAFFVKASPVLLTTQLISSISLGRTPLDLCSIYFPHKNQFWDLILFYSFILKIYLLNLICPALRLSP